MQSLKKTFLVLVLLGVGVLNAQDKNNPWQIGFGVNSVDIQNPSNFSALMFKDWAGPHDLNILPAISRLSVARYVGAGFSVEVAGSLNRIEKGYGYDYYDHRAKTKVNQSFWDASARVRFALATLFNRSGWFDPYLQLGGEYGRIDNDGKFRLAYGGGLNIWFTENVGLNLQTTNNLGFPVLKDKQDNFFQHSIGIAIKFGGKDSDGDGVYDKYDACPDVPGLKEFNGCPDSDGDGVVDSEDRCPNVAGLKEFNGCPDSDGDGVADIDDACPKVAGLKALKGCPDSDGDGVADKDDKCPNVAGLASNGGCPEKKVEKKAEAKLTYKNVVYFAVDKSSLDKKAQAVLKEVVEFMNKYPEALFVVQGNTDNTSTERYNEGLSERRAASVKKFLVKKGIKADRIKTEGFGESRPVAPNNTKEGRALNRRVEIILTSDILVK